MAGLRASLREAIRKLAYSTSVDQLKKSGIKRVNVLGIDRIVALIDEAVNRSLKHRLLASERAEVADATKEEFLRLLRSNEDLKRSHDSLLREKQEVDSEADALRLELQQLRAEVAERMAEAQSQELARYEGEDAEIDSDLQAVFEGVEGVAAGGDSADFRDRVRELVMQVVGRERRRATESVETARNREVELMQRRISKLQKSLDVTEKRLQEVAKMKNVEDGIASIYREVQGLSDGSDQFERKRGLMDDLFKANLALQRKS
jgi:hypothetical protein